jgi:hypothetical protein
VLATRSSVHYLKESSERPQRGGGAKVCRARKSSTSFPFGVWFANPDTM